MTPTEVIYQIKQNRQLAQIWARLSRIEKEEVIRRMATQPSVDLEKVLLEVKTGQNRLF